MKRVDTREKGGSSRTVKRVDVGPVQEDAVGGEVIEGGSAHVLAAAAEIAPAKIISDDEEDVWARSTLAHGNGQSHEGHKNGDVDEDEKDEEKGPFAARFLGHR